MADAVRRLFTRSLSPRPVRKPSSYKADRQVPEAALGYQRDRRRRDRGLHRLLDTFRTLGQLPKVEKAPIALAELVEELRLDPTFAVKLEIQPPPRLVTVRADKLLLKRVLANLVENGIHAGQEAGNDGKVVVAWLADARGDSVRITGDDRGNGVSEENRDKIFEPRSRGRPPAAVSASRSRARSRSSTAELSVAPDRPVTGVARFVITLPLRGPDASLG